MRIPAIRDLGHEAAAEAVGDRLSAVADTQLAEQPPRVGLHGVFGQVELAPDLTVALALAHAAQHLELALRELDTGVRGLTGGRHRRAREGVSQRGHQLGTGSVPAAVTTGATRDRGGNAARVVRGTEHDDVGLRVGRDEPPGRFNTGRDGALGTYQHDVDWLT